MIPIIWSDPCSDEFIEALQFSVTWIASLNVLDVIIFYFHTQSASATALGYIDYNVKNNTKDLIYTSRKKRLAFSKFSLIMSGLALILVDTPTGNCVFPLLLGCAWNGGKIYTQMAYNQAPERFFQARTFLNIYNILFLIAVWYKLRESRRQKLDLEFTFFQRVESLMLRMSNIFQD